jgi:beta-lactamase regulating signal transducer with metallopeptidase domain
MSEVFLKIMNMSISASWLVLAVLLTRLVLKKAPKWVSVLLWGFVAVRLICPFSIESALSLIPSAETISPEIMMDPTPKIHTGIGALNGVINPAVSESFTPDPGASMNPLQFWIPLVAIIWTAGIAGMLIYTAVSYRLLRRKVATAVRLQNNIFQSENVDSPFVLGIIKPKIYLPFRMESQNLAHVITHEESHIRRKDHWWKPFGFILLAIHWFNPLMWLGYILFCRDIELACDEKVIREMDNKSKADYTQALVACSVNRRSIAACPLAFGEVGVKERVRSVLNYKKPAFWIVIAAIVMCVVVAVCFLTNPATSVSDQLSVFIDCQIADHFQTEKTYGNASCVNWEVLGMQKQGSTTTVYMWVLYEEYSMQNGQLRQETGAHIPTVITAEYKNGAYKLIEYWEPRDGSYYAGDIREKFPWHLQNKALDSQRYIGTQKAENEEMAWDYFQSLSNMGGADDPTYVTTTRKMTLSDVEMLSLKGMAPTWEDFNGFTGQTVGTGPRVMRYDIGNGFYLLVGEEETDWRPAYVILCYVHNGNCVNIRGGDVKGFIQKFSSAGNNAEITTLEEAISNAVLQQHEETVPDGFLLTESHMVVASETVSATLAVGQTRLAREETAYIYYLRLLFDIRENHPIEDKGIFQEAIVTFYVDENGKYTLKRFLRPQYSSEYDAELFKRFASAAEDVAKNEQKYAEQLLTSCWTSAGEFVALRNSGTYAPPGPVNQIFDNCLSWAGWTGDVSIFSGALNRDQLQTNHTQHLPIYVFKSRAELDGFMANMEDHLTMDAPMDEVPAFRETAARYDDEFFRDNTLILVYVPSDTCSHRYGATGFYCDGTSFVIHVEETTKEVVGDTAMGGWFVTVVTANSLTDSCTQFDAYLYNPITE